MATEESIDLRYQGRIKGKFSFLREQSGWTTILYELSPQRWEDAGEHPNSPSKIPLLRVSPDGNRLVISPVTTLPNARFLKQKYPKLETITLEGEDGHFDPNDIDLILEELPRGFIKDPDYGLFL